jgi:quinoprotein glucose dehydrogenase
VLLAAAVLLSSAPRLVAQSDWTSFGHDAGQTRFSPLDQINTANAGKLQQAWVYHMKTAGAVAATGAPAGSRPLSQATPLIAKDRMYLPTPYSTVIALQPETGTLLWTYKLEHGRAQGRTLSYWPGDKTTPASLFFATNDGRLVSLNAETGKPTAGFGVEGAIDLKDGMYDDVPGNKGRYAMTSPGSIYKDLIITGSDVQETPGHGPSGDVRAWDVHTGKLVWRFHTVPRPGETGHNTWPEDGWKGRSGTNMWGFSSVDLARGLVFLPTGSPTSDNWGGDRAGDDLFGNSLVALHADTGKLAWYFQTVHHDIYDYDLESAPVLVTVHRQGKTIPAVAVIGKAGLMYILDRRNGKPVFGVEERPVPQSTTPGEHSSPTQPFPLKPVPLGRETFSPDEIANVTPEHHAFCEKMLATDGGMQTPKAPFTPYGSKLTIIFPSTVGVVNWHGMSYNPKLGYLFVNTNEIGSVGRMAKRPAGSDPPYDRTSPWGTYAEFEDNSKFWPCQQPPWGQLWAINVNTGDVAWKEPFGTIPELDAKGVHNTGSLNYGGSIATAGGLIFIAASDDQHFRAIEAATGKILWDIKMDTGAYVTPSTYLGKDGRQFVAIVSTGGSFFDRTSGDSILAFALPGKASSRAMAKTASKPPARAAAKAMQ